jgi:deoxycytidine triphosphate deaminase
MLSHKDIARALGKGIHINPFDKENVEGASIYLTASKLAWSSNNRTCICNGNEISIPPNDTAIIITNEIVQLNNKYAATCHARLTLTMKGLSYYATPIKPGYRGKLIIFLQNNTNVKIPIKIDEKIVAVMFYKLSSKTSIESNKETPDLYLFVDGNIRPDEEQKIIYKTPKSPNESKNNELYKDIKRDKSFILDIILIFICSIAFIASLLLIFYLPPDKQNFKEVVQIFSPFAGGGTFTFLYKLLRK